MRCHEYTGNRWSHRNSNERLKQNFGSHTMRALNRLHRHKTAVLGTAHVIRKVLQCETGRVNGGDHSWFRWRCTGEERGCVKRQQQQHNNNNNNNNCISCVIYTLYIIQRDSERLAQFRTSIFPELYMACE